MSAKQCSFLLVLCLHVFSLQSADRPPDVSDELARARQHWQTGDALEAKIRATLNSGNDQYLKLIEQQDAAYDQAKKAFIQALAKAPKHSLALSEFGRFWLARRELGQARRFLEAALQNKSGQIKEKNEAGVEQIKLTGPALSNQEEADLHRIVGGLTERAGEESRALVHYRAALEADPENPRNRLSLAIGLCAAGRPQEAVTLLKASAENPANDAKSNISMRSLENYTLALAYEETGFIEEALSFYKKALQLSEQAGPSDALGISERARMSVARMEDLFDALTARAAERARENEQRKARNQEPLPDERENLATASRICDQAIKFKEQALDDKELLKAIARVRGLANPNVTNDTKPDDDAGTAEVLKNQAFKDSFLPAMQMFQEAITKYPRLARAYYELAVCNVMLGRYGAARKLLTEAVTHSPNSLPILNLHGEVLLQLGQWEAAIDAFKRTLSLEPDSGRANLGLAWAYLGMQMDLKQCQAGLDALDRAEQLGARGNKELRDQLAALVQKFEKGETSAPVPKIRGSRPRNAPERAPGVLEPWGLGR